MKFEEIFKEDGLYKTKSFAKGVAFKVENGALYTVEYEYMGDINPTKYPTLVYGGLFNKEYEKVYTRQSLWEI
jgi:hypothetical protein